MMLVDAVAERDQGGSYPYAKHKDFGRSKSLLLPLLSFCRTKDEFRLKSVIFCSII